jgi:hypothetical protein
MQLKSQDILFLLKLVAIDHRSWTFNSLALELGLSPSEVHSAAKRAVESRLAIKEGNEIRVNPQNLVEFLSHGVQYCFIADRSGITRGVPTAYAAPPLRDKLVEDSAPPPVWPDPDGEVRGEALTPLHKSIPRAVKKDTRLYELLALVDSIRIGKAREKEMAKKELKRRIEKYGKSTKP